MVTWSGRVIVGAFARRLTLASPACVSVPSGWRRAGCGAAQKGGTRVGAAPIAGIHTVRLDLGGEHHSGLDAPRRFDDCPPVTGFAADDSARPALFPFGRVCGARPFSGRWYRLRRFLVSGSREPVTAGEKLAPIVSVFPSNPRRPFNPSCAAFPTSAQWRA